MACLFKANKVTVKLTICKLRRLVKSQLFCKLGGLGTEKDLVFNASSLVEAESRTTVLWWNWSWQMDGWLVPPHHTMVSHHWCGTTPYYCEPPHYSGRLPHSCQRERQFAPIVSTSYPASLWPLFPSYFYSCTRFIHSQPFDLYLVCQTSLLHCSKLLNSNSVQLHIFVFSLYSHCTNVLCCECGE